MATKINLKVTKERLDVIVLHLKIYNLFVLNDKLTTKELDIASFIYDKQYEVIDTSERKEIKEYFKISNAGVSIYIKTLLEHNILVNKDDSVVINSKLNSKFENMVYNLNVVINERSENNSREV